MYTLLGVWMVLCLGKYNLEQNGKKLKWEKTKRDGMLFSSLL